jgi:NTP pyrophosphatase (non-canonical NTP hydrolase)
MTRREIIMNRIHNERDRQDELWGEQKHSPGDWVPILVEEVGEVCTAINDGDMEGYPIELVQVAAVAVSMLECFEKNPRTEGGRDE